MSERKKLKAEGGTVRGMYFDVKDGKPIIRDWETGEILSKNKGDVDETHN